jgi:WD40 repeat protein
VALGQKTLLVKLDLAKKKLEVLDTLPFDSWGMEFTRDCSTMVVPEQTGDEQNKVNGAALYRIEGGKLKRGAAIDTYRYPVSSTSFSDDGRWLAVSVNTGQLILYRLDEKGPVKSYEAPALKDHDMYLRISWGSSGRLLAGAYKGNVRLFTLDAATGKLGAPKDLMSPTRASRETGSVDPKSGDIEMPGGARVMNIAFGRDLPIAWAVVESGQVFAWNLETDGKRVAVVNGLDGANSFARSDDGTLLAAGGNFSAQVWKLDGLKASAPRELDGLQHIDKYVLIRDFHFAGKQLLVGTGDLSASRLLLYSP